MREMHHFLLPLRHRDRHFDDNFVDSLRASPDFQVYTVGLARYVHMRIFCVSLQKQLGDN